MFTPFDKKRCIAELLRSAVPAITAALFAVIVVAAVTPVRAGAEDAPYLADRGSGIPTSMFGTYINKGDILFYPFYEYYYHTHESYTPDEVGYSGSTEYQGKFTAHEGLIFLAYGFTDWLMVEMEAAVISAKLEKASDDPSGMPGSISESGLGDVEGQVRWRWFAETDLRPEMFSFFEVVGPTQSGDNVLIGTPNWEFKPGIGVIKGFGIGTFTLRASFEYSMEESEWASGEFALEYLKRINDRFRIYLGLEGNEEELSAITELQVFITDDICIKINNGWGITESAQDYAPEAGVMFRF